MPNSFARNLIKHREEKYTCLPEVWKKYFSYCIEQTILLFVIIACAYYFKDVFLGPPLRDGRGALFYFVKYFSCCVEQTILLFVIIACAYYFKDVFLGPPLRDGRGALFYFVKYFSCCVEQTILLFVIIACAYYFKDVFLRAASS